MSELATNPNPFAASPIAATPQGVSAQAEIAREVGEVQAALVIAKRFPRDERAAVDRILTACGRQRLAESAAYEYARGGQAITGPSIRLAEALAVNWGNMLSGVTELSRSGGVSECLAFAWDLETNTRDEKRFHVKHWRDTKKGGYALTDERDIYELVANSGARRKRACILSIIPGDVQEAALDQCAATLSAKVDVTPERIASMVEAFEKFGVSRAMIEKRVQRRLDTITPGLMLQLGRIYTSLADGMSTPGEWFDTVGGDDPAGGGGAKTTAERAKERLRTNAGEGSVEGAGRASAAVEQTDGEDMRQTVPADGAADTSDLDQGPATVPPSPVNPSAGPHDSGDGEAPGVPAATPGPVPAEAADLARALTPEQVERLAAAKARRRRPEGGAA